MQAWYKYLSCLLLDECSEFLVDITHYLGLCISISGFASSSTMLFAALLSVAAVSVSAAPLESRAETVVLPLKKHANVTSISNIVQKGHARINAINGEQSAPVARASSGTVTNEDVSYIAPVSIGGKTYDLIVDTGCELFAKDDQNDLH